MKRVFSMRTITVATILLTAGLTTTASGQSTRWLSGAQFEARLKAPITSTWKQPLRDVIHSLRNNFGICIFTDRRIDPEQSIELQVEALSLEQTLRRLALMAKADLSFIRNVIYLGPQETTNLLATVAEIQAQDLQTARTTIEPALFRPTAISWNRPAKPGTILADDADRLKLIYSNPKEIPFDLWDSGELAALPFAYRTTILLAGFGKTFQFIDNSTLRVIDFPQRATFQTTINRKVSPPNLARVRKQFPTLQININADKLTVQGRWEEVSQLKRLLNTGTVTTTKPATPGSQVYTLTVENQPVQAIIQAIAQQEKLEINATEQAQQLWSKRISIEVKQLSLNELLSTVAGQAMLTFNVADDILTIDAADK